MVEPTQTTGITDVEWLDAKVCELSDLNDKLMSVLGRCECEMRYAGWWDANSGNVKEGNEQRLKLYQEIKEITS